MDRAEYPFPDYHMTERVKKDIECAASTMLNYIA